MLLILIGYQFWEFNGSLLFFLKQNSKESINFRKINLGFPFAARSLLKILRNYVVLGIEKGKHIGDHFENGINKYFYPPTNIVPTKTVCFICIPFMKSIIPQNI